ncbi:hypothetical protein DL93DRAFT_659352 [Clavulina sp. PMI_390]|nr:hypothetical protein DL93DRAFT_659352 [Clavulina sp. PMI_390]
MLGFRFRFLVFLGFVAQAMGLELMWPNSPAAQSNVSVQFFGGVTPYDMTISNNATKTVIYTYLGNDNVTYWEVNVDAGTVVVFKVVDATGLSVTSTPITVTILRPALVLNICAEPV